MRVNKFVEPVSERTRSLSEWANRGFDVDQDIDVLGRTHRIQVLSHRMCLHHELANQRPVLAGQ